LGTIRFLLAFAVVCAHVGTLPFTVSIGGVLAVQSFYIISGFLIALVWTNKYQHLPSGLSLFYSNRAARIYFLYWTVLLISIAVAQATKTFTHNYPAYFVPQPRALLPYKIFTNAFIFGSSAAYWLGFDDGSLHFTMDFQSSSYSVWWTTILAPAWTLDLELTFYLLAPFLVNLRLRYFILIIAASFAARFSWYAMGHDADPWNYRFFPFEIGLFLTGVATYRVSRIMDLKPHPLILAIFFAGLVLSVAGYGNLGLPYGPYASFLYLFAFAALIPYVFKLTRSWSIDGFLADMSFPLYLAHWPVSGIWFYYRDYFHLTPPWPEYQGLIPAIACVIATALLVIFVERPVERWRQSRVGRQAFSTGKTFKAMENQRKPSQFQEPDTQSEVFRPIS
jgi:peptidoglycan/LPS O-acetylase OafA/YrhL